MARLQRYEVLHTVARGGQGEVSKARDTETGAEVAIKVRPDHGDALAEAQRLRHLKPHPGLPVAREAFVDDGRAVLVTSWIEGRSLAEILDAEGDPGLPLEDALRILEQVADALDHLHGHTPPIVHGDVKPANIVVTGEGRAVLVDLGSATRGADAGSGTPGFAAPESATTPAADLYGLAATVYTLLTGIPPQLGMRTRWTGLPPRLARRVEAALRRGLAADPARRPRRASDLTAALRLPAARGTGGSNVPTTIAPLFGRANDIREIRRALGASRVVTLTGRGGMGKTRVAQEIGRLALSHYPDGVWWVDVGDAPDVARTATAELGLSLPADADPAEVLAHHLGAKRALLVLDGSEERTEEVVRLLDRLLQPAKSLDVLVTSRRPVEIVGERVHQLTPLPISGAAPALDLFWEHASASTGRRGAAARSAAEICRLVDGIPLAVELAAARTHSLTPTEVVRELRHRTADDDPVTAAARWSADLLSSSERSLLGRLTVFPASADLEAVEAVCADTPSRRVEIQARLWHLARLSLVEVEEANGRVRYGLHRSIRDLVADEVPAEERHGLEGRLVRWFADVAACLGREPRAVRRVAHDGPNLEEAVRAASRRKDVVALGALARGLWFPWTRAGRLREAQTVVAAALDGGDDSPAVHHGAGVLANHRGDWDAAIQHLGRAIEGYGAQGDVKGAIEARGDLMRPLQSSGDHDGYRALVEHNAQDASRFGEPDVLAATYAEQGWLAFHDDEPDRAAELFDRAIEMNRRVDDPYRLHLALRGRSLVAMQQVAYDVSRLALTEAIELERQIGDTLAYATSTMELGFLSSYDGSDLAEARRHLQEALRAFRDMGHELGQGTALHGLGQIAYRESRLAESAKLLERSLQLTRSGGVPTSIGSVARSLAHVAFLRKQRAECARWLLEALTVYEELVQTEMDTIDLLEQAAVLVLEDRPREAAGLVGFVDAWRSERNIPSPADSPDDPRTILGQVLGEDYHDAHRAGATLGFREAAKAGRRLLEDVADT